MLQFIMENYKKKSWLRMCTLHNLDKWEIIDYTKEPIYFNRSFLISELEVKTRYCYKCGTKLTLGIYKEKFIIGNTCKCSYDGIKSITKDKLRCVFTEDQVKLAIKNINLSKQKGLPNTMHYWRAKGYSDEESILKISDIQTKRSNCSPTTKKGVQGYSIRTKKYWTDRGFTNDEAVLKIKEVQTTNGLAYYERKYGEDGKQLFNDRINRWLNSPGNKNMILGRSKKSLELFAQLGDGYYGINEKTVQGKQKVHRVDFLHNNKIIEYYGDYWHGNPKIYSTEYIIRRKKIVDVWKHDAQKIKDLELAGYLVLIIWETEYNTNPTSIIQQCKEFLK